MIMKLPDMKECIHRGGDGCDLGVNVRALGGDSDVGWGRRIPCIEHSRLPRLPGGGECEHRRWATDEERTAKFAPAYAVDAALNKLTYEEQRELARDAAKYQAFVAVVLGGM